MKAPTVEGPYTFRDAYAPVVICQSCHGHVNLAHPPVGAPVCACGTEEPEPVANGRPVEVTPPRPEPPPKLRRIKSRATDVIRASDLMALELPPVRWIVPDILPEGLTLFGGKPKMGKSWLALGLGVAVASGGVALGIKRVEQGDVLYLALEDNHRRLQRRLSKMLGSEPAPGGLSIATEWSRLDDNGTEALDGWLIEHPDTRLVVIDTLQKVRPRQTGRNQYAEDYGALEPLLPIASAHGVAILVVTHLRQMPADDPLEAISGSNGLTGGVDGALVLTRERGRADAFLYVEGRDIENPAELALKWDANVASWTIAGDADEYRMSEERRKIVELLANSGEPMRPKEIAEALARKESATKMLIRDMVRDRQLNNPSRGLYTLPTDFADQLTNDKSQEISEDSTLHIERPV